ncbi:cyclic lactone autoinducer peptide [Staphylococcus succinus]|nr:cyclic lactone autoinducer peptide [Staphylococcus succinus]MBU0439193.1 cyclic lactone autoinducer peptide [Staphylococcus succinus]MEB7463390.1 cyclic lactone autoinducer peptide [Staphylococcus succinus]OEK98980.1 accessory regulator AgrD [Staphylococcus succinus]PKI20720.1 cyclic lactone autoinducer peptide [Staphylococcus succinus]PTI37719.1 cyclic lactone autoinducer peptide [Staphylococcus succinus]
MNIFESILNLVAKFFTLLGTVAGAKPCGGWLDEPEVPSEITKLYE